MLFLMLWIFQSFENAVGPSKWSCLTMPGDLIFDVVHTTAVTAHTIFFFSRNSWQWQRDHTLWKRVLSFYFYWRRSICVQDSRAITGRYLWCTFCCIYRVLRTLGPLKHEFIKCWIKICIKTIFTQMGPRNSQLFSYFLLQLVKSHQRHHHFFALWYRFSLWNCAFVETA